MRRRLAIAGLAVVSLLAGADAASACSCAPSPAREKLRAADGAFIGRLVAVREVDPPADGEPVSSAGPADFVYRVGRVYKRGPRLHRGLRVRVRSTRDSASCGLPDRTGRLYGLFLYRAGHRWHSNSCLVVAPATLRRAGESAPRGAASAGLAGCG